MGRRKSPRFHKTIKGVKTTDAPTISEEVVEQAQDQIIQKGTKELDKPTLTLTNLDKEELKRSAKATLSFGQTRGCDHQVHPGGVEEGRSSGENPDPFRDRLGSCFSGLGLLQGLYARNDHGV